MLQDQDLGACANTQMSRALCAARWISCGRKDVWSFPPVRISSAQALTWCFHSHPSAFVFPWWFVFPPFMFCRNKSSIRTHRAGSWER